MIEPTIAFTLFIALRMIGQVYAGFSSGLMRYVPQEFIVNSPIITLGYSTLSDRIRQINLPELDPRWKF